MGPFKYYKMLITQPRLICPQALFNQASSALDCTIRVVMDLSVLSSFSCG